MNQTSLRIHAIILALNEEVFMKAQLDTIYPFCSMISVISQYDRDWYGKIVSPDSTSSAVLNYPDPDGKINFVVRRMPDEAAARNMEMLSFNERSYRSIQSHGRPMAHIEEFHQPPDYFWIIDADEIYDVKTIPGILQYLADKKPKGMRVTGYNYLRKWNMRVPRSVVDFTHFGFLKPGVLFEQRRIVNWNEFRIAKLFKMVRMQDMSSKIFGFITCPETLGVFHHGCWLGNDKRIREKFDKSSHSESVEWDARSVDSFKTEYVPTSALPANIQNASWPADFIDE